MANKAVTFLRGSVRVYVESAWPERVFNVCSARGIALHEPQWLSATELIVSVDRTDYRALRRALADLGAEMRPEKKYGAPFLLFSLRRRCMLFAGIGLMAAVLIVNSLFIWDLRVSGNETVKAEKILYVLAKNGVHRGAFVHSFRSQDICNRALLELPELSWLTVNVRGCRANVLVRERVKAPEIADEKTASNVVARRSALVTGVRAIGGEAKVLKDTMVTRGQLLIAGVTETQNVENPSVAMRMLAGKGEVWGRTWYELSVTVPLDYEAKRYTGEEKNRYALLWGEKRLKFPQKDSSNLGKNCDKIIRQTKWSALGAFALPVTVERETLRPYDRAAATRTRADAEKIGRSALERYLAALLGRDGSITNARFASAERGGEILVTLSAECLEQIGEVVPIPIESNETEDIRWNSASAWNAWSRQSTCSAHLTKMYG